MRNEKCNDWFTIKLRLFTKAQIVEDGKEAPIQAV
jgi:hypothetical protein